MSDQSRDSSPDSARSRSSSRASSPAARSQSGSSPPRRSRSRSKSYSSSSSSSPRFVSATDSEAEKKSEDSPRRRKVKTKKSPKPSSSDDSDSDAEQPSRASRPSRAAKKPTTTAPKKKKKPDTEAEEGEVSSSADSEVFDDGLDEDLIRDEDDRARLENMTEFEREKELLKRAENREEKKKRFEIEKKLKKQQKLRAKESGDSTGQAAAIDEIQDEIDYNNVMDTKERSQNRQKKIEEKKFDQKSSALSELKAKRQEKERKDAERQQKASERDDDDRKSKSKRSSQRSSSSSSSGGSDHDRRRSSSSSSRSSSGSGSDTERFKKSPSKVQKYIESQEDLESIRLSRYKMEKYIHSPFFKTLVMNCFVRIGIGQHHGQAVYRAAEIVDVVETAKVYHVGNSKTNLGLRLKFGKEERVFRVEFISNQHISPGEFEKWKAACQKADLPLPTIEFVKSKALAIKKANNYNFTSDDIEKIVEQKEKFASNPKNYAMAKARWIKEKEIALANGDEEKGRQMEQKLHDLEERAEELDKKRTNTISSVALINDRNRKANVDRAYEAIRVEMEVKKREGEVANPFKRQKCNPRIPNVSKFKTESKPKLNINDPVQKENIVKIADTTITPSKRKTEVDEVDSKNNIDAENNSSNNIGDNEPKKKKNKFSSGLPSSMQKEDLFDAHDFDIDIDVDIGGAFGGGGGAAGGGGASSATSGVGGSMTTGAPSLNLKTTSSLAKDTSVMPGSGSNKRSFNMKDYKEKRGLQ